MDRKTTYLLPTFAAVFALMFAFASPLAMAESGDGMSEKWIGQKQYKMHKVIEVEEFVGSIQITEDVDRQTLKDQITVSLAETANELDVMGGHIGVVINQNDDKFLVWMLKSIERNSESEIAIATIYVVDAGNADNTTSITKEFDRSTWIDKFNQNGDRHADITKKLERLSQPTGDVDVDAARSMFVEKLQELQTALENGDSENISELRDELKDLRSELGDIKSYRK